MKFTIPDANLLAFYGDMDRRTMTLDAEKIRFEDGGDEYTLEEIRTVMRNRRRNHTRKLDEPTGNTP